jgi:Flp pilus assembly protein TadD
MLAAVLLFWLQPAEELYRRGVQSFEKGEPEAAIESLRAAVKEQPQHAKAWKALGVVYAAQANYSEALWPFEQACILDARLEDACYFFGRALYALNRFEPSIAVLEKALSVDRKPWRVHQGIAQAAEALGQTKQAYASFRAAMRLHSAAPPDQRSRRDDDPRIHFGVFLFRQGRVAQALEPLEEVVRERPDSGKAHFELGRCLYQSGRLEEAAKALHRAVDLHFGAPARLLLGKTLLRLGRVEEAGKHLHER